VILSDGYFVARRAVFKNKFSIKNIKAVPDSIHKNYQKKFAINKSVLYNSQQ
jgi:hypothetical protein